MFTQKDALVNLKNGVQLFYNFNMFETFFTRKDRYIFLLNVYFVKIKNEHGNVHFN